MEAETADEPDEPTTAPVMEKAPEAPPKAAKAKPKAPRRKPEFHLPRVDIKPTDAAAGAGYLLIAITVLSAQWRNLGNGYLVRSGQDQQMWEWFFAATSYAITHFDNPLGSTLQNAPDGVNMMANTAMLGIGIPLFPVTLIFGPTVTFALALTLGLAGTAYGWYWLFRKFTAPVAAAVGGAVAGFAPAIVSHANGHPNFVALFLLPIIAGKVIGMAKTKNFVKDGAILGALIAYQVFLGEEALLISALAFAIFGVVYALSNPHKVPLCVPALPGVILGGAVAVLISAGPLWYQFYGPASYTGLAHGSVGNDLAAFANFPAASLAGGNAAVELALNSTEENAFLGWPLLIFLCATVAWLHRSSLARVAAITTFLMFVLSLGNQLIIAGRETGLALPWAYIGRWPLLDSVVESRLAIGAIPLIALLMALGANTAWGEGNRSSSLLWVAGLVAALMPIAPMPLPTIERSATPEFFAEGTWDDFIDDGSLVTVPLPAPENAMALRWQREQGFGFRLAGGYFVGPSGPEGLGKYGPDDRPTALLLRDAARSGELPDVDDDVRAQAAADLKFWQADALVLPPGTGNAEALRALVDDLTGVPGLDVADSVVWDVRASAEE